VTRVISFPFPKTPDGGLEPEFTALLQSTGLARVELPLGGSAWIASRYNHVKQVLGSADFSRAKAESVNAPRFSDSLLPPTTLMGMDNPRHEVLRRAVGTLFSRGRVEACRPLIRDLSLRTVAGLFGNLPCDGVSFFHDHSLLTLGILLGLDEDQSRRLDHLANVLRTMDVSRTAEWRERGDDLESAVEEWLFRYRMERSGRIGNLFAAQDLSREEMVQVVRSLFLGGISAPTAFLSGAVRQILVSPEFYSRLRTDPESVPLAVQELLRVVPTGVSLATRFALADAPVGDTLVRRGDVVVPVTRAANLDPEVFESVQQIHLEAPARPNLAFGYGSHYCPGAPLSRLQAEELLKVLMGNDMRICVDGGAGSVAWAEPRLAHGIRRLIVTNGTR
jgi:cytochrome P450